jgi:hypothetical protein
MDWFEKLTGFREIGYEETRARLTVDGGKLRSRINGASYGIGELELVSLRAVRQPRWQAPTNAGGPASRRQPRRQET